MKYLVLLFMVHVSDFGSALRPRPIYREWDARKEELWGPGQTEEDECHEYVNRRSLGARTPRTSHPEDQSGKAGVCSV